MKILIFLAHKAWELDESRIDYRVALDMLEEGWGRDDAARAIRERSPGIEARHRNPNEYAEKTAGAALEKVEERQAQRRRAEDLTRIFHEEGTAALIIVL